MAPALIADQYECTTISISEYIYRRILQLDIKSIFGVPGDFVLDFCEEINKVPELNWVGTCNELNGSYAADAYGKISGKIGVFVSTYGVGELSAINGVAGAFLEFSPLLHIVGTSSRLQKQLEGKNIHHLIQKRHSKTPNHYVYEQMINDISIVQESLSDVLTALLQIDNAIEQVYKHSRPGYIFLPFDMATQQVPLSSLQKPLDLDLVDQDPLLTDEVVDLILNKLYASKNPALIVDYLCRSFRQTLVLEQLVAKLNDKVNLFTMSLSKGFINESLERFGGVYCGIQTPYSATKEAVEKSDFVLDIGSFDVQNNNGNFTAKYQPGALVEMNDYMCSIGGKEFEVHFVHVLLRLVEKIDFTKIPTSEKVELPEHEPSVAAPSELPLTQNFFASQLEKVLRPQDILVVETCSFLFTVPDLKIPDNLRILTQNYYNSIGYALPATIGAALANRELGITEEESRIFLVQGDGALLMTLQELTTYMRQKIKLSILLLNNDGYTVERVILGEKSLYNDIPENIQWTKLFGAFGDVNGDKTKNRKVFTELDLCKTFKEIDSSKLQMVELILDRMDAPDRFRQMIGKLPK